MKNQVLYFLYAYDNSLFVSWFCENKDRPQLHCNGNCKLKAMNKKADEDAARQVFEKLQIEAWYCNPIVAAPVVSEIKAYYIQPCYSLYYEGMYAYLFSALQDKPPPLFASSLIDANRVKGIFTSHFES
jgi:hypothetical protein